MAGKAQASTELIAIMGISLLVVFVFSILAAQAFSDISLQQNYRDAYESAQALAGAADAVYAQGEGATKIVAIKIPPNALFGSAETYIGRPVGSAEDITSKAVAIKLDSSDVYAFANVPVSGSLPSAPGIYQMKVVSHGNYVSIYPHLMELDRNSLYVSMAQNESRTAGIRVFSVGSSPVAVFANFTYGFSDLNITITAPAANPFNATLNGTLVSVRFDSSANASGLHNIQLILNATSSAGRAETLYVPVNAVVLSG